MYNNYIPIKVKRNNKYVTWYMDISKLGVLDLLKLKKELIRTSAYSAKKIDSIIYEETGQVNKGNYSR